MGVIINEAQHAADEKELLAIAELVPVFRRHCSHHFRNSISGIMLSVEMAIEKYDDPDSKEEIRNHLHRIKAATEHLISDMERIGL